jgi:hypothetical protein
MRPYPHPFFLLAALITTLLLSLITMQASAAQGLKDVLGSDAMRKITSETKKNPNAGLENIDPYSNYAMIWDKEMTPKILNEWLGVRIIGYNASKEAASALPQYAAASITLTDRNHVSVQIDTLVPRDSYASMAQHRLISAFNKFRPPSLDVIAEQVISIQGLEANYYRTRNGACSIVFDIERHGIVNLRVKRCSDSKVMMDIANALTFSRLNQKLTK